MLSWVDRGIAPALVCRGLALGGGPNAMVKKGCCGCLSVTMIAAASGGAALLFVHVL